MTFQSGIITKYVIGGSVTSFLFNDTQISVDSSNGLPTTVKLQPIDPSQGKTSVFVQDDGNNCSVGKITIVASAGNLINGSPTLVLDTDGIGVEIAITDQNNFIANLSSGGALPIPNNPYDYYLDGTVAVGGDGSIESPFKTLTELNNAVLLLPPNANIYTANVLPDPSGYGNEVVGTLNIAENLNLIGINAPSTTINCPVKLTSTGLGSGATILQYRNIAFTNVFTVDLSLSTIAFVSFIDGQFNINRIDNNVNGAINMQGGIFSTTISGGVVNLLHSLLFGDITISGGASVYSVDTQLYGGTFKLVGNCTLKTLSTLNPIAGYVDGTVDMSGTPSWITDEASNESYTGTLNRTILGGGDSTFINPNPTTIAVGGYPIGSTFPIVQTMQQMWDNLLYPYIAPVFSSFSISGQSALIEVGVALSGFKNFVWGTTQPSNVQPNSVAIRDVTSSVLIASGLANDGSESVDIGTIVNTTPISQSWRGEAVNTQSAPFQSANFNVSSIYPYFYGKVASGGAPPSVNRPIADQSLIDSGTKVVANSNGTITINFNTTSDDYMWFAIPSTSTSKLVWFIDALNSGAIGGVVSAGGNLFPNPDLVSIDSPTVLWNGIQYKIYIANYQSSVSSPMQLRNS